jgi:hypothetical protein
VIFDPNVLIPDIGSLQMLVPDLDQELVLKTDSDKISRKYKFIWDYEMNQMLIFEQIEELLTRFGGF